MHLLNCFLYRINCILESWLCYGFRCRTQMEHLPIKRLWELRFFPLFYLRQSHLICHHYRINYWHTEDAMNSKRCLISYCEFHVIQEMLKFKWKKHCTFDIWEIIMVFDNFRGFWCHYCSAEHFQSKIINNRRTFDRISDVFSFIAPKNLLEVSLLRRVVRRKWPSRFECCLW